MCVALPVRGGSPSSPQPLTNFFFKNKLTMKTPNLLAEYTAPTIEQSSIAIEQGIATSYGQPATFLIDDTLINDEEGWI